MSRILESLAGRFFGASVSREQIRPRARAETLYLRPDPELPIPKISSLNFIASILRERREVDPIMRDRLKLWLGP